MWPCITLTGASEVEFHRTQFTESVIVEKMGIDKYALQPSKIS